MFWKLILLISLTSFGACNPFGNGTKVNLPTSNTGSGSNTGGGGGDTSFGTGADGDVTLTADLYNTFAIPGQTKKWGKTARVTSISGNDINLAGAPPNDNDFTVGDEIMCHITTANASCSTDACLYLGAYGFANITATIIQKFGGGKNSQRVNKAIAYNLGAHYQMTNYNLFAKYLSEEIKSYYTNSNHQQISLGIGYSF